MNDSVDPLLDSILNKAMDSGIKDATGKNSYYLDIAFNDGSRLDAWNVNKYYGWLSRGVFTYPDNKRNYVWVDGRPKKSTMARLYKMLSSVSYQIKLTVPERTI